MRPIALSFKSLWHYRRTNLAVSVGVVTGAAVLTGALLVGDSMRGSLRDTALDRLGNVDFAIRSPHFFRANLGSDIQSGSQGDAAKAIAPVILLRGGATHIESRARAERIDVLGVDQRYWALDSAERDGELTELAGRTAFLNERLARQIGATKGDDILVRMGKQDPIATDSVLGRKDATSATLRVTVAGVTSDSGLGGFSLNPQHHAPMSLFIPLSTLQRVLDKQERANLLLVQSGTESATDDDPLERLTGDTSRAIKLEDLGLQIRSNDDLAHIALESDAMLLPSAVEDAALAAARTINARATRILTHLANSITLDTAGGSSAAARTTPYSTVAAIEPGFNDPQAWLTIDGTPAAMPQTGEIVLNEWAADDLAAKPGDRVKLSYYVTDEAGRLGTATTVLTLRGIVELSGAASDPNLTPQYPGITDVRNIADWDPPFPVDLEKIRDKDEAYWDAHQATPKAFVSLQDGRRLWASQGERFGSITSLHIHPQPGVPLSTLVEQFRNELLAQLDVGRVGITVDPVRRRALDAGAGTTDFGGLFIGFSFFLILSAFMLIALLFRLGAERRAKQIGLLLAVGMTPRQTANVLLIEGVLVAALASGIGLLLAGGYAWLMLAGLRTWWASAVNAPFLTLHGTITSYAVGYVASVAAGTLSVAWAVRGLTRQPPNVLLSGATQADSAITVDRQSSRALPVASLFIVVALALVALHLATERPSQQIAFFGSGGASLVAALALTTWMLRSRPTELTLRPGPWTLARFGMRNARRHPTRSLLTVGLIASATFLIVSLEAFRVDIDPAAGDRESGTGGFTLYAESAVGLPYDLNDPQGRERLGIAPETATLLDDAVIVPFRLRAGDETSCLNLYKPAQPRILGATDAMIKRGGFAFASTLREGDDEQRNPWLSLEQTLDDGAAPAIGDEAAVKWQLHLGLGKDLPVIGQRDQETPLRFVALLQGSALQGELVVPEARFLELFPHTSGYAFFLIDAPPDRAAALSLALERDLERYGFDAGFTAARLRDYTAVQNTYIGTFQTLGGLGLVLGTLGSAAVLLRNVWERRSELALMQALGFTRRSLGVVIMAENATLVAVGLLAGIMPALIAVAPYIARRPDSLPWASIGMTLAAVCVVGMTAGVAALASALRAPLLSALRSE